MKCGKCGLELEDEDSKVYHDGKVYHADCFRSVCSKCSGCCK